MKHDVIVVGGSYSGMAAALQLLRARRSVLMIDAGAAAQPLRQPLVWVSETGWHRFDADRAIGTASLFAQLHRRCSYQ